MKALVQEGYGSPAAVLHVREIDIPRVDDNGVLVRVQAASVNALDWHTTRGMPYLIRGLDGWRSPRENIRGVDLAGRVEAVGRNVTGLKPGDEVFGGSCGSFAEYTVTQPARLAPRPAGFTTAQAATLYIAALTALQGLRDAARLRRGQRVLIIGAGGGVGTFAVQIARWLGAHVTAVTRPECIDVVRALGAHETIDYRLEDFARRDERYDVVFDIGGNRPLAACRRVLTANGTLAVVGGPPGRWLAPATRIVSAIALNPFVPHRLVPALSKNTPADLLVLKELAESGTIRPVLDREYALNDAAAGIAYVGTAAARGKVVIGIP